MKKPIVVFDVDGVITDSWTQKINIAKTILKDAWLFYLPWVYDILKLGINRKTLVERIYELHPIFNPQKLLESLNAWLHVLEKDIKIISESYDFITQYHHQYDFFTNTSTSKQKLLRIFQRHHLQQFFVELLAYEDGTKRENIEYILNTYHCLRNNLLFIDDMQHNLDMVTWTWVHTLLFSRDWIRLEEKIQYIFWK